MVGVLLLVLALLGLGLLAVRSSTRAMAGAGQQVARERARASAEAAIELAAAYYRRMRASTLDAALAGDRPQLGSCPDPCRDCIPDASGLVSALRGDVVAGAPVRGPGPSYLRVGAVSRLPDARDALVDWCDVPLRQLAPGADAQARVSVWIRNDPGDALWPDTRGSWTKDTDRRVVLTAVARVHHREVAAQRLVVLGPREDPRRLGPRGHATPHPARASPRNASVEDVGRPVARGARDGGANASAPAPPE